jgi:hypothetical protein
MKIKNVKNKNLESIWLIASKTFPVCHTRFQGRKIDLNAENRIQLIQTQILTSYSKGSKLNLPPLKSFCINDSPQIKSLTFFTRNLEVV